MLFEYGQETTYYLSKRVLYFLLINFLIVDNNKHLKPEQAEKKFKMLVGQGIDKFLSKPIKNKQAKKWIEKQKLIPKKDLIQMMRGR